MVKITEVMSQDSYATPITDIDASVPDKKDGGTLSQTEKEIKSFIDNQETNKPTLLNKVTFWIALLLLNVVISVLVFLLSTAFRAREWAIKAQKAYSIINLYLLETVVFGIVACLKTALLLANYIATWTNQSFSESLQEEESILSFGLVNSLFWNGSPIPTIRKRKNKLVVLNDDTNPDQPDSVLDMVNNNLIIGKQKKENSIKNKKHPTATDNSNLSNPETTQKQSLKSTTKHSRVGRLIHRKSKRRVGTVKRSGPYSMNAEYRKLQHTQNKPLQLKGPNRSETVGKMIKLFEPTKTMPNQNLTLISASTMAVDTNPVSAFSPIMSTLNLSTDEASLGSN